MAGDGGAMNCSNNTTDLVERLRATGWIRRKMLTGELTTDDFLVLLREAADEIERLREETENTVDYMHGEIEKLKTLIAQYAEHVSLCEGSDFLGNNWKSILLSDEDWKLLQNLGRPCGPSDSLKETHER